MAYWRLHRHGRAHGHGKQFNGHTLCCCLLQRVACAFLLPAASVHGTWTEQSCTNRVSSLSLGLQMQSVWRGWLMTD
jgi:hypothetical protein